VVNTSGNRGIGSPRSKFIALNLLFLSSSSSLVPLAIIILTRTQQTQADFIKHHASRPGHRTENKLVGTFGLSFWLFLRLRSKALGSSTQALHLRLDAGILYDVEKKGIDRLRLRPSKVDNVDTLQYSTGTVVPYSIDEKPTFF
jgi:hypothetical protein